MRASGSLILSLLSDKPVLTAVKPLRLLVVSCGEGCPDVIQHLVTSHPTETYYADSYRQARDPELLGRVDAVVLCDLVEGDDPRELRGELQLLTDALASHRLIGVVLSSGTSGVVPGGGDAFIWAPPELSVDELWGRLITVRECRPMLQRMEKQVSAMQRLGKRLNQHFVEVDQELRLASRLQRDFLPKQLPEMGDLRFAALYRPATWVSGDVYDVKRLDEDRLSFYLADAVGHGVAAGLLTMFIKQWMVGKRIDNERYTILEPQQVLQTLNTELARQELPNCQFITACYAVADVKANRLTFARGGHPHPIHVTAEGTCSEVRTIGGLLGVFDDEEFPEVSVSLEPGEKFIIYSDGLEDVIVEKRERDWGDVEFTPQFREWVRLPAQGCMDALASFLDRAEGSLAPTDDQTVVMVERLARPS